MAHISSIGASLYSDLSVCIDSTLNAAAIAAPTQANLVACFAATEYARIRNVREFPAMGTPANIVNVAVFGQRTSSQVQGQADPPTLEITLNYIPADWAPGTPLGSMVGDTEQRIFRFTLLNEEPGGYDAIAAAATSIAGTSEDAVQNSSYYFIGRVEALQFNPQLTDATTATLTLSIQSDFFGAYTL